MAETIFVAAGAAIFLVGFNGFLSPGGDLRRILAINVMGVGVFTVLIATAYDPAGASDPVPHALVITGIVVAFCGTALALALVRLKATVGLIEGAPEPPATGGER